MTRLVEDPLAEGGVSSFGTRFRRGEITSEEATRAYVARIEALDSRLGAFEYVAAEQAVKSARAMDELLASGTDLGPLMGIPIAIKDLIAVEGMPTTAGSKVRVDDLIGPEGSFVRSLRRAGCVILGKTKTDELALGITGMSAPRGTPWNPCDSKIHRLPGGSSSGSAVAVAGGLCAFAIGTDTGGSVRVPGAFCGVFGFKTTPGFWAMDGVLPLAPQLDTLGLLTKSALDASVVFSALTNSPPHKPALMIALRLGKPTVNFFDRLDPQVERAIAEALDSLERAGSVVLPLELPEAKEREKYFPSVLPASLIAVLGRERFMAERSLMDPVAARRADAGLEVHAAEYIQLENRRTQLFRVAEEKFKNYHAWVCPTTAVLPAKVSDLQDPDQGLKLALELSRNTQFTNLLGLSAATIPIPKERDRMPVGLQIVCPAHADARTLSIAVAIEQVLGARQPPVMDVFCQ